MRIRLICASLVLAFCAFVHAGKPIDPKIMKIALASDGNIKAITQLPIQTLKLVETQNGKYYFISANGRFVFKGTLFDVWKNQSVDSTQDAQSLRYLPLSHMGVDDSDMALFKVGNPNIPRQGYIIVDPTSKNTKILFDKIMNEQGSYHLDILPIPVLAGARETIKRLWCAKDKNLALTDLVLQTNTTVNSKDECDTKPIYRNIALFSLLDMKATPIIVREDGYRLSGIPKDLKGFLLNKDKIKHEKK